VSALGSNRTLMDELCCRFLTLIFFCLSHRNVNSTVNFIIHNSLFVCRALSPVGCNFVYISQRYSFSIDLVFNLNSFGMVRSYIFNFCCKKFYNVCTPSFLCLTEAIMLHDKLFNFDPAFETLSSLHKYALNNFLLIHRTIFVLLLFVYNHYYGFCKTFHCSCCLHLLQNKY